MKCKIIAEAATNHLGQLSKAKDLVIAARDCGADYIKFQAWQCRNIKHPTKRDIERELSDSDLLTLRNFADKAGIKFLVSIFDIDRIGFIKNELGCDEIKIPSQDLTAWELLKACYRNFGFVYLSTGMSTVDEIQKAKSCFPDNNLCLLHCVSKYPHTFQEAELAKIEYLPSTNRGYSDHTETNEAAKIAFMYDIDAYECHFTIRRDKSDKFSLAAKTARDVSEIVWWRDKLDTLEKPDFRLTINDRNMRWKWKNYRGQNHGSDIMRSS
ncbi:hypothetical protein LCGC14_2383670 [marine sediment metagenome]|uniref:PseI/NeuA/B-like domain-containing protein n=1 Tax=marine sediment metagenome TaxID=412755 RepID=A0A0F9ECI0_9ZZZZ